MEEWKSIIGFEDYMVSDQGRVKSFKRRKERILKHCNSEGYHKVNLYKEGKLKTFKVHQLVMIGFMGFTPCGDTLVINHINGVKTDNRLVNLEITTQRDNVHGTFEQNPDKGSYYRGDIKKHQCMIRLTKSTKVNIGLYNSIDDASTIYKLCFNNIEQFKSKKEIQEFVYNKIKELNINSSFFPKHLRNK